MKYIKTYLKILILIAIIIAIIYGVVNTLKKHYTNETVETVKTDMMRIEGKIKIISEKVNIKEKDAKYIGKEISEVENEKIQELENKEIIKKDSKDHIYYVIDKDNIKELELNNIELKDDFFIVDYKTHQVIYSKRNKRQKWKYII